MIAEVSKSIAHVDRYGPAERTWLEQQETINEIKDNYMLKELDKKRSEP